MDLIAQSVVVAIVVALAVVVVLMIPCCFLCRRRTTRILTGTGAALFAIVAVIAGDAVFTRWALYTGGHGDVTGFGEWIGFVAINAILATGAGITGGALGMVIGLVVRRRPVAEADQAQKSKP